MRTEPDSNHLWLYPGELAVLLENCGCRIGGDSPLSAEAALRFSETFMRSRKDLFAEIHGNTNRAMLSAYLRCLAQPDGILKIKRGMRRRPVEMSFVCSGAPGGNLILLKTREDEGVELIFPLSVESLSEMLSSGMRDIQPLNMPMDVFMPLSPGGIAALLALADLFNEFYPVPDPQWQPETPVLFTLESWHRLIEEGLRADPQESLVAAFLDLTGTSIPSVGMDELKGLLLVFANQGYIGVENAQSLPGETDALYYAARELTIALRCLAWRDISLGIENYRPGGENGDLPLHVLQATAVWQFEQQTDSQQLIARAMYGQEIQEKISNILRRNLGKAAGDSSLKAPSEWFSPAMSMPAPKQPPVKKSPTGKPAPGKEPPASGAPAAVSKPAPEESATSAAVGAQAIPCPVCARPVKSTARFCRSCGAAVHPPAPAPASNLCPGCGKTIRPQAAFCKHCGQKLA